VARERLLRLYARDVALDEAAADGVTASFVRELVRRAVLRGLGDGTGPRSPRACSPPAWPT
jgi:hypothetical protein